MKTYSIGSNKGNYFIGALFLFVIIGLIYQGMYTLPRNYTPDMERGLFN